MADYERLRERHLAEFSALVPEHLEQLRWPVERIREEREWRLRALLAAARERSSWHAGRLAAVDPATATEADLVRIPPMTKDDMMAHLDGIFTDPRLSRRIADGLVRAGMREPQVAVERVEMFARQATGKLKRFVPLAGPAGSVPRGLAGWNQA